MDDLEKLLGEEQESTPDVPPAEPAKADSEPKKEDEEVSARQRKLEEINKAISEGQAQLSAIRKQKRQAKTEVVEDEEEDVPQIDFSDKAAKAWDRHISKKVTPLAESDEQAKAEIRNYALRRFLEDKPALARDSEKVKKLMTVYDRLHTASERTVEGVLDDLDQAYGAITYQEQQLATRAKQIEQAKLDQLASEAAISKGATGVPGKRPQKENLSEDDKDIVSQWERSGAPKI